MNTLFAAAGLLVLTAAAHSVMGERLIFSHWRKAAGPPAAVAGILQATWHALSVLGVAVAVVLWRLSTVGEPSPEHTFITATIAVAVAVCAVLVLVYTRGKHPGWLALCVAAILVGLG